MRARFVAIASVLNVVDDHLILSFLFPIKLIISPNKARIKSRMLNFSVYKYFNSFVPHSITVYAERSQSGQLV